MDDPVSQSEKQHIDTMQDGKNEETAAVKRSKAARRRRLSYVVDEEDVRISIQTKAVWPSFELFNDQS